jgi:hypothetical protein
VNWYSVTQRLGKGATWVVDLAVPDAVGEETSGAGGGGGPTLSNVAVKVSNQGMNHVLELESVILRAVASVDVSIKPHTTPLSHNTGKAPSAAQRPRESARLYVFGCKGMDTKEGGVYRREGRGGEWGAGGQGTQPCCSLHDGGKDVWVALLGPGQGLPRVH